MKNLIKTIFALFLASIVVISVYNATNGFDAKTMANWADSMGAKAENCIKNQDCPQVNINPSQGTTPHIYINTTPTSLDKIRVVTKNPNQNSTYNRENWKHWSTVPGKPKCWNVREEVLLKQGQDVKVSGDGCSIVSGTWIDPYTGQTFTDPKKLDIDHIVPLNLASDKGGYKWNPQQKETYANDLEVLLAVSAKENRAKGKKPINEWLPPNKAFHCTYGKLYAHVLDKYGLPITPEERNTLAPLVKADCR